jgi:Mg/Co/Ni transporter MgtE
LVPNPRIQEVGLEKADAAITELYENSFVCIGTIDELVELGLAETTADISRMFGMHPKAVARMIESLAHRPKFKD